MQVILGLICAGIAYVGIAGVQLPLLGSPRAALIALTVVGMAMCSKGMGVGKYAWTSPFMIAGIVVGAVALTVALAGIFGLKIPYVTDARAAIIALSCLMALKVVIALVRGAVV